MDKQHQKLFSVLQNGIPIESTPFLKIAEETLLQEKDVLNLIHDYLDKKLIRRFGTVIQHRQLGYQSNAMCVWQIPEHRVDELAQKITQYPFVTLCYERKTYPSWPFNLYCMIHGKDRTVVESQIKQINSDLELHVFPKKILFSRRCFKQRGARYFLNTLDEIDKKIINTLQDGIDLIERPFLHLARELNITESEITTRLKCLIKNKSLSRFAPLYNVEGFGGQFILAAMQVPQERFEEVNQIVNSFIEVAHNYERDHSLNMWFVVGTETPEKAQSVIKEIEKATGLPVLSMPKLKEFYLELKLKV